MYSHKKGFTIVELIVVITILSILSTIGFISYSGYLVGARDANRLSQIVSISEGLNVILTKGRLPFPDAPIKILSGTEEIAYQGYLGDTVLDRLGFSNKGIDPKDKSHYLFYISKNRKYFQLLAYLESHDSNTAGIFNETYAATDYGIRYPTVYGNKLGILVGDDNTPLNEISGVSGPTYDISSVSQSLKSYLKDDEFVQGSGTDFAKLGDVAKVGGKYYNVVANDYLEIPPVETLP